MLTFAALFRLLYGKDERLKNISYPNNRLINLVDASLCINLMGAQFV
jgi:hypothetical protein